MKIEKLGELMIFTPTSELITSEIVDEMKKNGSEPGDLSDLAILKEEGYNNKRPIVALAGMIRARNVIGRSAPILINGEINHVENMYGDNGKWDTGFDFLSKSIK